MVLFIEFLLYVLAKKTINDPPFIYYYMPQPIDLVSMLYKLFSTMEVNDIM